ncbi:MAG TPA: carbohydrate ABC transporter permease [Thermomicrobiales bacterium]|nr:carbohydrate ABC transporter permease [Thermomicrobiales bacterium]
MTETRSADATATTPALKYFAIWSFLIPFFVIFLFPFAVMISTSLKTNQEVYRQPPRFIPDVIAFSNYRDVWTDVSLAVYFRNSLIIGLGTAVLALFLAVPAAYALARFRFRFRQIYLFMLLIIQMFSPIIIILALFKVVSTYHMLNSLTTLIVINAAFGLSYAVWLLTGCFQAIPAEIEEAAMMDGTSRLRAILVMTLPLSWPGIVAAAIFTFMQAWNEFLFALTFISDENKTPITVGLFHFIGHFQVQWNYLMAASLITTVIVLVLFMTVQKQLTRGMLAGGIK